jgi:hypothetical protein
VGIQIRIGAGTLSARARDWSIQAYTLLLENLFAGNLD